MHRRFASLFVFGFAFSQLAASTMATMAAATTPEVFGEALTLAETTPIQALLANPDAFKGKRVRIEGTVREVCPRKGCWMDLSGPVVEGKGGGTLRIKVQDDVIVFPKDAHGAHAVAEGVVEILELDREQYVRWAAHEAEERGESFDPASVGEGPFRRIQLAGTGAVLTRAQ